MPPPPKNGRETDTPIPTGRPGFLSFFFDEAFTPNPIPEHDRFNNRLMIVLLLAVAGSLAYLLFSSM